MYTKYYENYDRLKLEVRIRESLRKNQIEYQLTEYFPTGNITFDFFPPVLDKRGIRIALYKNNINADGETRNDEDTIGIWTELLIKEISNV